MKVLMHFKYFQEPEEKDIASETPPPNLQMPKPTPVMFSFTDAYSPDTPMEVRNFVYQGIEPKTGLPYYKEV